MGEPSWTTCRVGGVSVEIRTETELEEERATELMAESEILAELLEWLGPEDVFLDVGANVGLYSLFAATVGATAVAVEPHPRNLTSLRENIARNDLNVAVIEGALAAQDGEEELYVAAEEAGAGTHTFAPDQVSDTTIPVRTYTGDGLIARGDIPSPTVVKLDVQGAEDQVLAGLEQTLGDERLRRVYCEIHPEQVRRIGGSPDGVIERLRAAGFAIEELVDKADVTWNVRATR